MYVNIYCLIYIASTRARDTRNSYDLAASLVWHFTLSEASRILCYFGQYVLYSAQLHTLSCPISSDLTAVSYRQWTVGTRESISTSTSRIRFLVFENHQRESTLDSNIGNRAIRYRIGDIASSSRSSGNAAGAPNQYTHARTTKLDCIKFS